MAGLGQVSEDGPGGDWEISAPTLLFHGIVVASPLRVVVVYSSLVNLTMGTSFPGVLIVCSTVFAPWWADLPTPFALKVLLPVFHGATGPMGLVVLAVTLRFFGVMQGRRLRLVGGIQPACGSGRILARFA